MYKRQGFGEKCRDIDTAVSEVRGQGQHNRDKIEEIQKREIAKIREELEIITSRPPMISQFQHMDNREVINFKQYKGNPMELLERVDEQLAKTRENRWTIIRGYLDEYFRDINDNWWTATRQTSRVTRNSKTCLRENTGRRQPRTSSEITYVSAGMMPAEGRLSPPVFWGRSV